VDQMGSMIRIGDLAGVPMMVRLSGHDPIQIKRALDAGARGVIAPMVNTADQAARIVDAVYYPPRGSRGVGLSRAQAYGTGFDDYRQGAAQDMVVIAQVEHIDGVRNLQSIIDVEGIDGYFIGPYDLSGSVGRPGEFDHPDVRDALAEAAKFITAEGSLAGIHVVDPDPAKLESAIADGYRLIAYASEMLLMSHALGSVSATLDSVRS
jgi:2-keto-3-deoxy-L-rhamnonate aldolase RhmA